MKSFVFYHYYPSLAAAIVFVVLFFASTSLHTFQLVQKRTWYFIPFVIGGLFESVGYIGRAISSTESPNWTIGPYVCQSLLILLAPAFFAASIYMVLGRIIRLTDGESHSLIKAKWLTKLFVTGDILSFLTQSSGGGVMAKATTQGDVKIGENIIIGGLAIQVVFFGCFIAVAALFHYRISATPTTRSKSLTLPWKRQLVILYVASGLILVRSIFRIVEYVQGYGGTLMGSEIYLYIFDATLMFSAMVLFNAWHPSQIITKEYLNRGWQDAESQAQEHHMTSQIIQTPIKG